MTIRGKYHLLPLLVSVAMMLPGCTNNPYRSDETGKSSIYSAFATPPSKLDPANAYYSHEGNIIDQIYDTPFTYHYLKRPYELIPGTAEQIPTPIYYDAKGERITDPDPAPELVDRAEYIIRIRRGMLYQNHPCFARDEQGNFVYHDVEYKDIEPYDYPTEFPQQDTREVLARDYVLQVRRMADPRAECPIYSTLKSYILDLDKLHETYREKIEDERARRRDQQGAGYNQELSERENPIKLDYMATDFAGAEVIDDYTYRIVLKRKYPQILFWMAMHFFGPVPREALDFYGQPPMVMKQFSLKRCPVGSGPYYLHTFKPNELIILERNPNYREDYYPTEGEQGDRETGLLADAGKRVPFVDRQIMCIEKESIPAWSKFLQGYYDFSGITSDVFDQAIQMQGGDNASLSPSMREKNIKLITAVQTAFSYAKFNMLDEVVGGLTEEKRALRQAISVALDFNEYLDIFANGRGVMANGPLPPGIFGHRSGEDGVNPYVDQWDPIRKRSERQSIEKARELMRKAGYPEGRGPDGRALTLYFDHASSGDPTFRSRFEWFRRKLERIGIRLKERATDLTRYREKLISGEWQLSISGWLADYPDPENFLFLFYGPNGKVKFSGSNAVNYDSPEFDSVFTRLETMANGPERQSLINESMDILQRDAPAVWMYFPVAYTLHHDWYRNEKPHQMSRNAYRYVNLDPQRRVAQQAAWNRPVYWPVLVLLVLLALGLVPAAVRSYRRERGL